MTEANPQQNSGIMMALYKELQSKNFALPPLPESATKIQKALDDPDVDAGRVAKLLTTDPVLSGRLIQAANSPLFKGLTRIEDLNMAVSRLGLTCVQNLVISLTLNSLYAGKQQTWLKNKMASLWEISVNIAAISQILARDRKRLDPPEALLAGLLHDIGSIPILLMCDKKFGEPSDPQILDEALIELSPHLSQWIMEKWRLSKILSIVPTNVGNLRRNHDGPADYADVVQVARLHTYRGKQHPLGNISWAGIPAFAKLDLTPEESIAAIKEANSEIKEIKSMLKG